MNLNKTYYVMYGSSPVYASRNVHHLSEALTRIGKLGDTKSTSLEEVPEHHLTSALRLRIIPEVVEVLEG